MNRYITEKIIIITIMTLFIINFNFALSLNKLSGPKEVKVFDGNTLIVEAYANTVGEREIVVFDPYETGITHQACTYGVNIGEPNDPTSTTAVLDEKISVRAVWSYSGMRFTDPYGYDNTKSGSIPYIVKFALNVLFNFISSYGHLSLPNPWGLIDESNTKVRVYRDADLQGGGFIHSSYNIYNSNLMGGDWLWYLDKPIAINTWYFVDVHAKGRAGIYNIDWDFIDYKDINILLYADFYVTNSTG